MEPPYYWLIHRRRAQRVLPPCWWNAKSGNQWLHQGNCRQNNASVRAPSPVCFANPLKRAYGKRVDWTQCSLVTHSAARPSWWTCFGDCGSWQLVELRRLDCRLWARSPRAGCNFTKDVQTIGANLWGRRHDVEQGKGWGLGITYRGDTLLENLPLLLPPPPPLSAPSLIVQITLCGPPPLIHLFTWWIPLIRPAQEYRG